jgi:hypothetical protein
MKKIKVEQEKKDVENKDKSLNDDIDTENDDIDTDVLRLARSPLENFYQQRRLNRPSGWRDR